MRPRCPKCGSDNVRQITPTFYECKHERVVETLIPPFAHGNLPPIPIYNREPCRHTFQIESSSQVDACWCGRHSIGNCFDCGQALCGLHGPRRGLFLCSDCQSVRGRKEGERLAKLRTADLSRRRAEWETWQEEFFAELSGSDPTERLVRFLASAVWTTRDRLRLAAETIALLPDIWSTNLRHGTMPWDQDTVQAWFLGAVRRPPEDHQFETGIWRTKQHVVPGWTFDEGSTANYHPRNGGTYYTTLHDVTLLADGRRLHLDWGINRSRSHALIEEFLKPCGFNARALEQMARLAELPELPAPPESPQPPSD